MAQVEKNVHDGHRERTKQRFDATGFDGFADHEKLQMLLFFADRRRDTNVPAHALMERFGSLSSVFEADPHELMEVKGIGQESARLIHLVAALFREYSLSRELASGAPELRGPSDLAKYIQNLYIGETNEAVYLLSLTSRNRLVASDLIMRGSFDAVMIKAPEIVKSALRRKAPRVVLAHNHPSGQVSPSNADITSTKAVRDALSLMQIDLVDHIIIGNGSYASFVEMALL